MLKATIENIIVKYLNNEASVSELLTLDQWLKEEGHDKVFENFVKTSHLINSNVVKFNTEKSKKKLLSLIAKEKKVIKLRQFNKIFRYAAVILVLLGIGFLVKDELFSKKYDVESETELVRNKIEIGTDKATLTLDDGSEVTLSKGEAYQTSYAESDGNGLVYKKEEDTPVEIAHNVLTIPRGGQFYIQLADGTKVWLNSESQLKYPVAFAKGQTRQVELVYGEAYFEVSPSIAHDGDSFEVKSSLQLVEVLGTQFNIKSYKDEAQTYTTLVEGEVQITDEMETTVLKPGQQSISSPDSKIMVVDADVNLETAWRQGLFSFKDKTLKEIMVVLSRWYDVDIAFETKDLETIRFKGVLSKKQRLEDILSTIENLKVINGYDVHENKILIK